VQALLAGLLPGHPEQGAVQTVRAQDLQQRDRPGHTLRRVPLWAQRCALP
jgi:hypothetical protein